MTQSNPFPRMTALARTFPCFAAGGLLENASGVEPWDALKLKRNSHAWSSGERHAVAFLLSVFNNGEFDMQGALGVWDNDYRAAFQAWAISPWWE